MEKKGVLQEEIVKIEIEKLVPFSDYPFDAFEKGKRFEDMVRDVSANGMEQPIIVRCLGNSKYEILDGHYRVAAAKKLDWITVPALVLGDLDDEEAFEYVSNTNPVGLLKKFGIDIYDKNYKKTDEYRELENSRITVGDTSELFFLDQNIEKMLLTDVEVQKYYESIYDLGNRHILSEAECEYTAIANEIVQVLEIEENLDSTKDTEMDAWEKKAQEDDKRERIITVVRQLKDYDRQFEKYLNIDMSLFDYGILENKQDRAKLYYYFYKIKHKEFKKIKIMELLSKPSMENVDHSFFGYETKNGKVIGALKHAVTMELSMDLAKEIERVVRGIVDEWGSYINRIKEVMETTPSQDNTYTDRIKTLKSMMSENVIYEKAFEKERIMSLTPLGVFYLKLIQHEYLGQMKDLLMVYDRLVNKEYNIPEIYINKMKEIEKTPFCMKDIDIYFQADNVRKKAELVYLKPKTNRDERKKIVKCKENARRFLEFCLLYENNSEEDFTELLVISYLQEYILGKKEEPFDNKYHGYEGQKEERRNIKSVQAALSNDEHTDDALQIYWICKVVDRSYANVGREVYQKNLRELERITYGILTKILSCSSKEEMLGMNTSYKNKMMSYWHSFR